LILLIGGFYKKIKNRFVKSAIILGILLFIVLNIKAYNTYIPEKDTYISQKNIAEVIRNDSKGADLDIYGTDREPIYYILWYFEKTPNLKKKYYKWIKWSKKYDSDLVYYIEEKTPLTDKQISEINNSHQTKSVNLIYEYKGRKLYKFE
jgi:hypothetical protein